MKPSAKPRTAPAMEPAKLGPKPMKKVDSMAAIDTPQPSILATRSSWKTPRPETSPIAKPKLTGPNVEC